MDIENFLTEKTDALLSHGAYADAFEITRYVFVKLGHTDMDDDGEYHYISAACYDIWKKIISSCGKSDYTKIRKWFEKNAYAGIVYDFMEEFLQEFLENEMAAEEDLRYLMKQLDKKIEDLGNSTECPACYSSVGRSVPMVIKRIELMKRLGATEQEIEEYRIKHRHFSAIREQYMDEAKKAGDTARLIALLKESREMDASHSYKPYIYSTRLVDLYHQMNDRENERNERYEIFVHGKGRDIEQYRAVKALCTEAEWAGYRDRMLEATEDKSLKRHLYAEEGMVDSLYKSIFEAPNVLLLDMYGLLLAEDHSEEILQIYEQHVRKIAEYARNRYQYGQLTGYLNRMKEYSGGKKMVEKLIKEWITAYPTRKTMVLELEKLL